MTIGIPGVSDAAEIGRGAFGVVYKAHQDSFDRTVAVKVLANVDRTPDALERFSREVRAIGSLSGHPNIVSVHAHGTTQSGAPFLIMEYCGGGSYGDRLDRDRRLSWTEATELAITVAGALETSHRSGILHRDVKPDNILIDGYGVPKLADFGIARATKEATMTATGVLTGSPAHIAPEIIAGQQPSAASDVYSLASTLHALISGEPPFVRDSDASILPLLQRIATEPPADLRQFGVPGPVADAVLSAMAKQPNERTPSAGAFAEQLQAARVASGAAPVSYRVVAADGAVDAPDSDVTFIPAAGTAPIGLTGPVSQTGTVPEPAAGATIAPEPGATGDPGRSRGRLALVLSAVLVLAVVAVVVTLQVTGDDPPPGDEPGQSGSPTDGSSPSSTPEVSTTEVAEALAIAPGELAQITDSGWDGAPAFTAIDPGLGFCNRQLSEVPDEFAQGGYFLVANGPQSFPLVITAGAVFASENDAATYQRTLSGSTNCGSWSDGTSTYDVFEPPATPALVGCECQDVVFHEVVANNPDGTSTTRYSVYAQQGRYISAAFYYLDTQFAGEDDVRRLVEGILDQAVIRVNEVAVEAGS